MMGRTGLTQEAERWSAAFADAIGDISRLAEPGGLIGVEQEFSVRAGAGTVDFREVIHRLPSSGRRLDPGDSFAYRCPSGSVLTCDEREAEIALPPVALGPGFPMELHRRTAAATRDLQSMLPGPLTLRGFSTHISAQVQTHPNDSLAGLYAGTFGVAAVLLTTGSMGRGVMVRPRPGRLEVCAPISSPGGGSGSPRRSWREACERARPRSTGGRPFPRPCGPGWTASGTGPAGTSTEGRLAGTWCGTAGGRSSPRWPGRRCGPRSISSWPGRRRGRRWRDPSTTRTWRKRMRWSKVRPRSRPRARSPSTFPRRPRGPGSPNRPPRRSGGSWSRPAVPDSTSGRSWRGGTSRCSRSAVPADAPTPAFPGTPWTGSLRRWAMGGSTGR